MLILNGLRISKADDDAEAEAAADLVWRVRRTPDIAAIADAGPWIGQARPDERESGLGTTHVYGHDGRVRCCFRVNPSATEVDCLATPDVSDRDLVSLFVEPVMRTVLIRRGRLSFHAAALVRDGRAVLIAADKGAGKSTLSWALQRAGWRLFADDLACVAEVGGRWHVYPGHRQTKLTRQTAIALGYAEADLQSRFDENPEDTAHLVGVDKCVLPIDPAPLPASVPIAALVFLTPRDRGSSSLRSRPAAGHEAVGLLLQHATRDPLGRGPGLSPPLQAALGRLAGQVSILTATLPDSLEHLPDCAARINTLVPNLIGPAGR
ncbi:MAG: hypothetical protein ACXW3O_00975 [Brevundimonas sp.]